MRVLVCGGRRFSRTAWIDSHLGALPRLDLTIIEGGATGADHEAKMWATRNHVPCLTFRAEWKAHGRAAGPKRNQRMLEEGAPHLVLAFPGGDGTADMVRRARAAGVEVIEVTGPLRATLPTPNEKGARPHG